MILAYVCLKEGVVKLNNPLMGTETYRIKEEH